MPKLSSFRALLLLAVLLSAATQAQTHRVAPTEDVTRAVSVYEWTGDIAKPAAARLIPVSLYIDKNFRDGGTYYARPVPLALFNGNIYSLERAGVPQGALTIDYARHLQTAVSGSDDTIDLGWFGYGTFSPMAVAKQPRALHASSTPPAIVSSKDKDDDRPTFADRPRENSKASSADAKANSKKTPAASTTSDPNAASDDPDRPHFSKDPAKPADQTSTTTAKPADPASADPSSKPADTPSKPASTRADTRNPDPADDTDRPTLRHRDPKQAEADRKSKSRSSVSGTGDLNNDPDRPNMRRGVALGIGGAPAPQLKGLPADLHQMVAVSDPTDREPHPFLRDWSTPTEKAEILAKMSSMARQLLADYDRRNGLADAAPTAAARPANARTRRPAPAPAVFPLNGEQLTGYTLSYGGLPTFVYTAISSPGALAIARPNAPAPPPANFSKPARYVTVVAQQLPSGELQMALSSVTDAGHLDRTPWFRLVDAVDPDAEHRASLLFELRGHSSRQFALYRIISAKADQVFITHPTD